MTPRWVTEVSTYGIEYRWAVLRKEDTGSRDLGTMVFPRFAYA